MSNEPESEPLTTSEFRDTCRIYSAEAIRTAAEIMRNSKSDQARMSAIKTILEHAAFDKEKNNPQLTDEDEFEKMSTKKKKEMLTEALEKIQLEEAQEMLEGMEVSR